MKAGAGFRKGSAVCHDSLTDSNGPNIATATLSSDGRNLSVLITLDSPSPVHDERSFSVVIGAVQHQEDYVAVIKETSTGVVATAVTDSKSGTAIQVRDPAASITDTKVTADIPTADFPRLGEPHQHLDRPGSRASVGGSERIQSCPAHDSWTAHH